MNSGPEPVAAFTLDLLLPVKLFPPGKYEMTLSPASEPQTNIRQYDFEVRDEGISK
jgi:hypothetical protein